MVRLVVRAKTPRGVWGHVPPQNFLKFRGYEIASETILAQYDASRRPDHRISHECDSAHCVVHQWCRLPIQFAYRPKATPFAGEACETSYRSLVRKESCWKEDSRNSSVALFAAISHKHGTYVLRGVAWASAEQWR